MGKFRSPRVVPRERVRSPKFESRRVKLLRDGCACVARVKLGMRNVHRVHVTDIWSWYRVELRVGDHLGRSEELVSRCVECDLAEPESLASLGGSAPGVVDGILSKLKGVGPLEYHLGCTCKKDPDETLAADPRRYVNKILESYERMFMEKPRKSRPPLEGGDHPELDTSELCDEHQTKQFQTLIGQLQWLISLGRFDIAVHVMSLSRFRAQPRKGHLDRAKRIVGYLLFLPDGAIRFRTGEPDFSSLRDQEYDWTRTVYSGACEQIPHDIPKPLGKHVQTTHYVDANLHHDLATGKAVTAVLHFLNQTPIDAYTKRQSTVETATYGSEFVAARTAVEQIIDIRTTLRYLGVPIRDMSYMFGDNRSVVTSSTIPNSTISKRHHLASYHRVREAIAAKFISFHWKDGKSNPADILSKHWEFATVWPMLKPILFWRGETATQLKGSDRIPSTTPGAEPPRDAKDSGSARPHSTHLETSSTNRS